MKQQDIAVLILIVFFAGMASFFISNHFISTDTKKQKVEKVSPIPSDFDVSKAENINAEAINPTVRIEISSNNNDQPFTSN